MNRMIGIVELAGGELLEVRLTRRRGVTSVALRVFGETPLGTLTRRRELWVPVAQLGEFKRVLAQTEQVASDAGLLPADESTG